MSRTETEQAQQWLDDHHETFTQNKPESTAQMIEEYRGMIDAFKNVHNVEQLYAITEPTSEGSTEHQIRETAKIALRPIYEKLKGIRADASISDEETMAKLDIHDSLFYFK